MSCSYPDEIIKKVTDFHGHSCPGLTIGIRAAEYVTQELPQTPPASLVCVTETDMCAVDAVQYLTGCTYGKGNLIHLDYGKTVFSFFDRDKNTGFRLTLRDDAYGSSHAQLSRLMAKSTEGTISEAEQKTLAELRNSIKKHLLEQPLDRLFNRTDLDTVPPRPARVLASLSCDACSEKTMESRTRRFAGQTLCIPCFSRVEQKI